MSAVVLPLSAMSAAMSAAVVVVPLPAMSAAVLPRVGDAGQC